MEAVIHLGCARDRLMAASVVYGTEFRPCRAAICDRPALPGSVSRTNLFLDFQQPCDYRHWRNVLQHLSLPLPDHLRGKAPYGAAPCWTKLLGIFRSSVDHDHSRDLAFLRDIFSADRTPMYGSRMAAQAMETRAIANAVRGAAVTVLTDAVSMGRGRRY